MSSFGGTIPHIAITPDANDWNPSNNIAETLTDIEDLEEQSSKPKSKLKIKLSDGGAVTDVEDLEGSDTELETNVRTVSFNDLQIDTCKIEETGNSGNTSQNFKLRPEWLNPRDDGVTDAEDFATDDEFPCQEIPEPEINFDEYQSDYVNISSDFKQKFEQKFENLALPVVGGTNQLTDIESVPSDSDGENLIKKTKPKRRKSKLCHKSKDSDNDEPPKPQRFCKMKKSMSHPCSLKPQNGLLGFDSDGEAEDNCFLKFPLCKTIAKTKKSILTDTEDLEEDGNRNDSIDEKQNLKRDSLDSTPIETDSESIEGDIGKIQVLEIPLPPPVRTLIFLHEDKSLVPTTKILPLAEIDSLGLSSEESGGTTDVEYFESEGDFLTVETYKRAPTPDICGYEYSNVVYEESKLDVSRPIEEPLTDTEDLNVGGRPRYKKIKNRTLQVVTSNDQPTTDTEDFFISDKSPVRRQKVVGTSLEGSFVPYYVKDNVGSVISSKDLDGTSTTRNRLSVKKTKNVASSSDLTDVEDLAASGDEENIRSQTATPHEFAKHLEQQSSSKVHIQTTRKLDYDNPTEIMYLKGGSYHQTHTDVEDISEDNDEGFEIEWDVTKKSASQEEAPQDAEQQGEESSFAASGGPKESSLKAEGEESGTSGQQTGQTSQQRSVADQHQLSEEMKQLLKELEKESKQ